MSKESISKIYLIVEKIEYIEKIVGECGSITNALGDAITTRPAILMHLTAIAEQFNKLKRDNATHISSMRLMGMILEGFTMSVPILHTITKG